MTVSEILGLILLAGFAVLVVFFFRRRKKHPGGCHGCSGGCAGCTLPCAQRKNESM